MKVAASVAGAVSSAPVLELVEVSVLVDVDVVVDVDIEPTVLLSAELRHAAITQVVVNAHRTHRATPG